MITKNERTNDERRKNTQKRQLPFCKILECVFVFVTDKQPKTH